MPKEELLFRWKISLALFGFGSGKRPARFEVDDCNLTPTSDAAKNDPGDTDLTAL